MADGTNTTKSSMRWAEWVKQERWPAATGGRQLTIVDAFSGCGGMTLGAWEGARRSGNTLEIRRAIDINSDAIEIYRANFTVDDSIAICADVADVFVGEPGSSASRKMSALRKSIGELDMLVAGPPCQGHSDLNNRSRRDDPRNKLYLRAVRGVELLRPKVAIIENVPGVIHDTSRTIHSAADALESAGYNVLQLVFHVADLGLAQRRKRHLTVASRVHDRDSLRVATSLQKRASSTIEDFLSDIVDEPASANSAFRQAPRVSKENAARIDWLFTHDAYDLPDELRPACHRDRAHSYKSMYGRLRWNGLSQTITSGFGSMGQGRFVHPKRPRTLSCHEAARLQGFPDFFEFESCGSLTALRNMIGNAVPPALCAELVTRLFASA